MSRRSMIERIKALEARQEIEELDFEEIDAQFEAAVRNPAELVMLPAPRLQLRPEHEVAIIAAALRRTA